MLHLQGMGIVGCGVALALAELGMEFTWNDQDSPVTAWRACTGAIYPSAAPRDLAGYQGWLAWLEKPWAAGVVERADYWYSTKQPPHAEKGLKPTAEYHGLRRNPKPSLHLNAQRFVEQTRAAFAGQRREHEADGDTVVVTHGFNARLRRYVWGWTGRVRLRTDLPRDLGLRPCLYFRPSLVQMAYAYPIPGTDQWYAGSALITQQQPRSRDIQPSCERWWKLFHAVAGDAVTVTSGPDDLVEGWRPSTGPVEGEDAVPFWEWMDGRLVVMPMWHSGVRWLPAVVSELTRTL